MAIKGLADLLAKAKKEDMTVEAFEAELNKALPESWIPKTTYNELSEKHKLSESQLKEATTQLGELKDKAGLTDEYKAQIEKLTASQATAKADFDKQLADLKHGYALDAAIAKAHGRDAKLVKAILDQEKLIYNEDGTITGLDEQLKQAREGSYGYLFEEDQSNPKPSFGGEPTPPANNVGGEDKAFADMRSAAGLS